MSRRTFSLSAGAMAAALILGACTTPDPEAPEPASLVEERLVELAEVADGFSGIDVGRQELTAYALDGEELKHWNLVDDVEPGVAVNSAAPVVAFEDVDAAAVQEQVDSLAAECDASNYRISVDALTQSAMLAELRCGEESFSQLLTAEPTQVLLSGEPLADYSGASIEETWQLVLNQVELLDPDMTVTTISISDSEVSLRLWDNSATNGCRPVLNIAMDGSDVVWACWAPGTEPAIALRDYSASDLAAAQQAAMSDGGITSLNGLDITISPNSSLGAELSVRQGPNTATVRLG